MEMHQPWCSKAISFCTPVLSAVHLVVLCSHSSPLACSIRWYDPMNVRWSPMRPLTWTLYWRRWWCSSCGQGQISTCGHVPNYLLFSFLNRAVLFSITSLFSMSSDKLTWLAHGLKWFLMMILPNTSPGLVCFVTGKRKWTEKCFHLRILNPENFRTKFKG